MATADEIIGLMRETDKIGDDKSSQRLLNMYFKTKEIEDSCSNSCNFWFFI